MTITPKPSNWTPQYTELRDDNGVLKQRTVQHTPDGPIEILYPPQDQYAKGYADAMNWKTANHLEHLPVAQPEQNLNCKSTQARLATAWGYVKAEQEPVLQNIEQYRLQMAGISTAAIGYWKESDGIHPDYDTIALRDVAKLYEKYDELYRAQPAQQEPGVESA